jgi:hypothetical protein
MGNAAVVAEPTAVGEEPAVAPREEPQKKKRQSNISSFFAEKRVFERTE